jgi:putative DNA methylase
MSSTVTPFSLKDAPALIERLLPVQKLSAEAFKEQMAGSSKTLTALGSYWKGRKPLILNRACILGSLLPATENPNRDLEIFEKLMAMDDESFVIRWPRRTKPREILASISVPSIDAYFVSEPRNVLPNSSPIDWSNPDWADVKVSWRDDISELDRRRLEAQMLPKSTYRERVKLAKRLEEVMENVHEHIWAATNAHLGTTARSMPELVEQLGIMRFGHRPRLADTFCGSGQIPFEAGRLGCDVYASDLNPIACMLTWASFHIIGASQESRKAMCEAQHVLARQLQAKIDDMAVETDGSGWRGKVYLYCAEVRCPQSGWMVPLLTTRVVSTGYGIVADLIPDPVNKRYEITLRAANSYSDMVAAELGTIGRDGKFGEAFLVHKIGGQIYKTMISTLRGDYKTNDGAIANRLRQWAKHDFKPHPTDIFQERLYAVQWMRKKKKGKSFDFEFRSVTPDDIKREQIVDAFIEANLVEWQQNGWIPDMRIEVGGPPRYQGQDLIRARGWTYWHHLFNPRQLMLAGLLRGLQNTAVSACMLTRSLNINSKLSVWHRSDGGGGSVSQVFTNQALNTLYDYGTRASAYLAPALNLEYLREYPIHSVNTIASLPANKIAYQADIFVTDPPYGDAVMYHEITDFFIAWLRKNPPPEFSDWTWDSRRSLAIKGEDEDFRRNMVSAYQRMTACMPDNGIQVVMFTHQSGSIWADLANIVWASGLHVTAAWYVVTETDSALRVGSNVKGTVLLVLRKREGTHKTTRDDLAWEIQEEVGKQIADLTGLNQQTKGIYRDENIFEDADIQMAGYAAALRVLTRYAVIDGRDMASEAIRPRVKGETTFVDGLIAFAVDTANQCLVPQGIPKGHWDKLSGVERFYLKLLDMEARGAKTLDNYQNFAKAFKVRDFQSFLASKKANAARLKSAVEFGRTEMGEGSEFHQSVLRAVLYAIMELVKDVDSTEVLAHLMLNIPDYYGNTTQRDLAVDLADYLAKHLELLRPEEAAAARVLRELVKNQRLG